ncbi:MAG: DUF488 domain-containing protein [Candidatus Rokubacteria bacterium]|nr:DUF488 domain-containing protein [Candidatus Rokubacteria bacterium]
MNEVFTVGHSTRSLDALLALLNESGIEAVIDVRRWPVSARHPHLSREPLGAALASAGLAYVHLGVALGGYRDGGYEAHMATAEFQAGLAELENLARARRVAVL